MTVLRVLWRGITLFERYGWLFVFLNVVTVALSIPVITAPAAYAGLCHFGYTVQTSLTGSASDYWQGVRSNLGRGIVVGVANVVIFGILWSNWIYYANQTGLLYVGLRIIWLTIFVAVISAEFYLWPILDEMERPNLREGLRNGLVMTLTNPGFTLILLVIVLLLFIISALTAAPMLLVTPSVIACMSTAAVQDRLGRYRNQQVAETGDS